jgi:hypothetical protein
MAKVIYLTESEFILNIQSFQVHKDIQTANYGPLKPDILQRNFRKHGQLTVSQAEH